LAAQHCSHGSTPCVFDMITISRRPGKLKTDAGGRRIEELSPWLASGLRTGAPESSRTPAHGQAPSMRARTFLLQSAAPQTVAFREVTAKLEDVGERGKCGSCLFWFALIGSTCASPPRYDAMLGDVGSKEYGARPPSTPLRNIPSQRRRNTPPPCPAAGLGWISLEADRSGCRHNHTSYHVLALAAATRQTHDSSPVGVARFPRSSHGWRYAAFPIQTMGNGKRQEQPSFRKVSELLPSRAAKSLMTSFCTRKPSPSNHSGAWAS
jgi:hypothetical protein